MTLLESPLHIGQYERKAIYDIDEVLAYLGEKKHDFDGDLVKMRSARYYTFKKSLVCAKCGIEGVFFAKEKDMMNDKQNKPYHFNLYAINPITGVEILMTKDHIIPKAKGGANNQHNYQTMCTNCNTLKGATYEK